MKEEIIEKILSYREKDGIIKTDINSLFFYTHEESTEYVPVVYEPSLCIALQAKKEILLGSKSYEYDSNRYLLASIHTPARGKGVVEDMTYVALKISFSMGDILEILKEYKSSKQTQNKEYKQGLCFCSLDDKLLEPVYRLIKLLENPSSIDFLAPLIIKEILYIIVQDKGGEFL